VNLGPRDALVVVDVQRDFLPGGALPVPGGDEILPVLDRYIRRALANRVHVFATRDWHPADHCSFRQRGGPWPPHCVQGTPGAELSPALALPRHAVVFSKGTYGDREAYSAFDDTGLDGVLRALDVHRLLVGGLAAEVCVFSTVRDARAKGYTVLLLDDAVRGLDPIRSAAARSEMIALGAIPVTLEA
jgi:nicotinamidase/pyrazinamidase